MASSRSSRSDVSLTFAGRHEICSPSCCRGGPEHRLRYPLPDGTRHQTALLRLAQPRRFHPSLGTAAVARRDRVALLRTSGTMCLCVATEIARSRAPGHSG